jgi:hypothetical protein
MTAFFRQNLPKYLDLNGADAFFIMLDTKNATLRQGTNAVRISLTIANQKDAQLIEKKFLDSALIFWMCNIQLINAKSILFKPKWKYTDQNKTLVIREHFEAQEGLIPEVIINESLQLKDNQFVSFDRISYPSGAVNLVFSWHHALMDGRGSCLLMQSLFSNDLTLDKAFPGHYKEPGLYKYISNMYKVKRFIKHSSRSPIEALSEWEDRPKSSTVSQTGLLSHTFSAAESSVIDQRAQNAGAQFGSSNFLLACAAIAFHRFNKDKGVKGDLWIPVPYDGRKRGSKGPIISNQIAFLFYRLKASELQTTESCLRSLQNQFMLQLKMEMPKKYDMLLNMMRYIPLWLYRFLTSTYSKGRVASFLFTSAGQDKWDLSNLTNDLVQNIQMVPPSTVPPGLTFNFLRNENCLTLNILWSKAVMSKSDAVLIEELLVEQIMG